MPNIISKECQECGAVFSGPKFSTHDRKFCSHACYSQSKRANLGGKRFGQTVVLGHVKGRHWRCLCDCGREHVSTGQNLTSGKTQSCGHLQRMAASRLKLRHGASDTRAHNSWSGMMQRCYNPKAKQYSDYGGRGIFVDHRWHDFAIFLLDMGQPKPGMSIDRIDNSKGYSPQNCRWATKSQQQNNRRNSRVIEALGKRQSLIDWSRETGLLPGTIYSRIFERKWDASRAMTTPPKNVGARTHRKT